MTGRKLTGVEQTNTLKALQILRVRVGAWRLLAPPYSTWSMHP